MYICIVVVVGLSLVNINFMIKENNMVKAKMKNKISRKNKI